MRKDDDNARTSFDGCMLSGGSGNLVELEHGLNGVEHVCEHVDVVCQCLSR